MADIYPGAPGQSGTTDNLSGVLGIGAYSIPQANGGSGGAGNFGQMITEQFVRSFISSTAMNMGAGDGSLGDIVENLTGYLSQLELSSLKWLQPFIPGATDDDFSTTAGAVNKIISALNLQLLMGANEFQHWIDTIFGQLQTAFNQVVDIFNNVVVVPINASIQAIKDWWVSYTTTNPLWNQLVTWFNQIMTSLGIPTGTGAGTTVGSRIYTAGTTANGAAANANTQLGWWQRLPENILIILDGLHIFYPLGSPSDTALTTVGGKRTWYAAQADLKALFTSVTGATPTSTVLPDVGTFAQATQATVVDTNNTLAQVQANVDALTTNQSSVAGAKFLSSASGTASTWGSLWSVTATNANISPKTDLDLFSMNLAASSSVDLSLVGLYTGGVTLTDDQTVSIVFQDAAKAMAGGVGPKNRIKGRMDSTGANYVWAEVDYNVVRIGCTVAGVDTIWASQSGVNVPAGSLLQLFLGSASNHRAYQVRLGNTPVITLVNGSGGFTDSSNMGASYRGGGQNQLASHGGFNDTFQPARVKQFKLQDSNVQSQTYGTSARIYRSSTAGVAIAKGGVQSLGSSIYDSVDYASSDIKVVSNGFAIYTPGRYRITHNAKVSNTTPSWTAVAAGTAYGSVNQITAGPTVVSKAAWKYDPSTILGLNASFSFNAVGDGGATELWAPSIAVAGSGTYYVLGDGAGEGTWAVIERIG